jgi:biotin carboxyl carrier protein
VTVEVEVGGRLRVVDVAQGPRGYAVILDGRELVPDVRRIRDRWSMIFDHRSYDVAFSSGPAGAMVAHVNGYPVSLSVAAPRHRQGGERSAGPEDLGAPRTTKAPMTGKVVKVLVKVGDTVVARQGLVVIEAMKMENELRSVGPGRVIDIKVTEGMSVEAGSVLVVVE